MKNTGVCPKCGGQEIAVMRGKLAFDHDPRVRTRGGMMVTLHDMVPVDRYLCCACGYMESWVDAKEFVQNGGKEFWEKQEKKERAEDETETYWREKLQEKREKEAEQHKARDKQGNERDDPWN